MWKWETHACPPLRCAPPSPPRLPPVLAAYSAARKHHICASLLPPALPLPPPAEYSAASGKHLVAYDDLDKASGHSASRWLSSSQCQRKHLFALLAQYSPHSCGGLAAGEYTVCSGLLELLSILNHQLSGCCCWLRRSSGSTLRCLNAMHGRPLRRSMLLERINQSINLQSVRQSAGQMAIDVSVVNQSPTHAAGVGRPVGGEGAVGGQEPREQTRRRCTDGCRWALRGAGCTAGVGQGSSSRGNGRSTSGRRGQRECGRRAAWQPAPARRPAGFAGTLCRPALPCSAKQTSPV